MVLHTNRDVCFGGHHPAPADEQLGEIELVMKRNALPLGLATDGDADRFGVLDEGGDFLYPNELIAPYRSRCEASWTRTARDSGRIQIHRRH